MAARRILLVDDDPGARDRLRRELEAWHWTVLEADTPRAALELAKRHLPHLVLLDAHLPGEEPLPDLLKLDPLTCAIPIIALLDNARAAGGPPGWAAANLERTTPGPKVQACLQAVLARQRLRRPYILVVDDEPDLVEILTAALIDQGFGASGARDGVEALDVIETIEPDAVLLDLDMPRLDGWQFLEQLRQARDRRRVRVVVLTGKDQSPEDRERGLALGASDYLLKPCAPDDIVRALETALSTADPRG
jgi:DNA-binding response OmpR family regulator